MGPFCHIIWYHLRGAPFLGTVPFFRTNLIFNILWVRKKEPRYALSFSVENPNKRTSPSLQNRAPLKICPFTGLFYISPKFLIKISLNKEINLPCLSVTFDHRHEEWKQWSKHVDSGLLIKEVSFWKQPVCMRKLIFREKKVYKLCIFCT